MTYQVDNCRCKEIKVNDKVIAVKVTPRRGYHFIRYYVDDEGAEQFYYIDGYIQIPVDKFDDYITNIEVIEIEEKEGE